MKEEALKLADEFEKMWNRLCYSGAYTTAIERHEIKTAYKMIRKLVAELDKQEKANKILEEGYGCDPAYFIDKAPQTTWKQEDILRFNKALNDAYGTELPTAPQTKSLSDELTVDDYKECLDDVKRLTKELDIALNGDGAAEQASLCDIVCQVKSSKWKLVKTKPLSYEKIKELLNKSKAINWNMVKNFNGYDVLKFAREIEKEHGIE